MIRKAPWEKAADKKRRKTNSSNHGVKAVAMPDTRHPMEETNIVFRLPMLKRRDTLDGAQQQRLQPRETFALHPKK